MRCKSGGLGPALTERAGGARRYAVMAAVAATVVALDQLTKWWAITRLDDGDIDLFWTVRFHLARNTGAAFSVGRGLGWLIPFLVVAVVHRDGVDGPVVRVGGEQRSPWASCSGAPSATWPTACSGTAVVVDFIDFQWWPIFNVADISVTVGAILLVLTTARESK